MEELEDYRCVGAEDSREVYVEHTDERKQGISMWYMRMLRSGHAGVLVSKQETHAEDSSVPRLQGEIKQWNG